MLRFLIDENLPATLATKLPVPCMHSTELGNQPTDTLIWEYARSDGWSLLTKDADFIDRLTLYGPPKPSLVKERLKCKVQSLTPLFGPAGISRQHDKH